MEIKIPELSLVVLIGASGSGKSSFAKKHFKETEVLSSDYCRALVSDDENNQKATDDAFDVLNYIAAKRLKNGLLTVIDATNVQKASRNSLVALARKFHCLPVAIVLDLPESVCAERNKNRTDRNLGNHVIRNQRLDLKRSVKKLKLEGFRHIFHFKSEEEINALSNINRDKLYTNKKEETGPFDIIGDVHGCYDELVLLLQKLNYQLEQVEYDNKQFGIKVTPPAGRKAVFLGDLVDRGPASPQVLKLAMSMVNTGSALCVPGNHDVKLNKYLNGKKVQIKHGLQETIEQLASETDEFKREVKEFIYNLRSHYVLDGGKLVVAHAGLIEEMQGRGSGAVRSFCLYGETTGEIDEFGLPVRYNWAKEYRGAAKVIYGHTPVPEAEWFNKTIDIDTGCVFGGKLTALRYPEEELVAVDAKEVYCEPVRPLHVNPLKDNSELSSQQLYDDLLNIEDVTGKRIVQTRLRNNITIREENSIAALEVMSRFAINPKWLMYLPPTMSPCGTSTLPDYLEYPEQALNYYRKRGVKNVICEEKHMGSRAVLVVCKDEETALKRFGVEDEGIGICYTRTGRNFFNDTELEKAFLERVSYCLTETGFWKEHNTDWVCLDTELMPWSAKAQALIKDQYASVGAAATMALPAVNKALEAAKNRGIKDIDAVLQKFTEKEGMMSKYVKAYRQYCWPVKTLLDFKLAPFHILATEGAVHTDKNHLWHMETIAKICQGDPDLFTATPYKLVDFDAEDTVKEAINWWEELTAKGGEGMVVKPLDFITYGKEGLLQPAVKCRGKEYLRIIYGPDYDSPENIERLKNRGLSRKRSMAIREFALGVESLERFVKKEPLRRIHESVFGVLALESEVVDPRL
ncbi:polynucleotide kinase-phosphatase [Chondrinema litorale]|uniref:polynucleotide kinase-phosphatase n=1 Tax=Chondrinema litorale TaxID=2994555 RepID=UPI002544BC2D|nr:polynucleotide kinase-phosphatase [Chondrinema litorale]UZR94091.1 polynucleotide kinase-phosphatase [Chondrinema litorale]